MRTLHDALAPQTHLDPAVPAVVEGEVLEELEVEVRAELSIEDAQNVAEGAP